MSGSEGNDRVPMGNSECAQQNQQPAAAFTGEIGHYRLDLGFIVNRRGPHRQPEGWRRLLDVAQDQTGIACGSGIEKDRHVCNGRVDLRQHLRPFPGHRRVENAEAGDVAARARQILDEALANRVDYKPENDRDRTGLMPQRLDGGAALADEHLGTQRDQLRSVALEKRGVAAGPAPVDVQIIALFAPEGAEPLD